MKNSGNSFNISNYKPTDSQQDQILQIFPFAGESEPQSSSDDLELLTGIMMVSVSESSQDYQTPPEHHSNEGHVNLLLKTDLDMDDTDPLGQNIVDLTIDSGHDHDSLMVDTQPIENLVTEAFETELTSTSPPVDKVFDQMPNRGDKATTCAITPNLNTLNRGKRKLPFSIDQTSQDNKGKEAFTGIMDRVLSLLGGLPKHDNATDDADIDLIETAKMRGMTFPRPRWWPPQGSEE